MEDGKGEGKRRRNGRGGAREEAARRRREAGGRREQGWGGARKWKGCKLGERGRARREEGEGREGMRTVICIYLYIFLGALSLNSIFQFARCSASHTHRA
jgi:hypothetical protein